MDTILVSVTGIALAIAASMGALLARMLREERRRSDARVALLTELSGEATPAISTARNVAVPTIPRHRQPVAPRVREVERPVRAPQRSFALDELEIRPVEEDIPSVQDLFHEHEEPSAWPRRFAVIGTMAVLLAVTVFGYKQMRVSESTGPQATGAPVTTTRTDAAPLELVSLRHAQENGLLTITGLVQNPRSGVTLSRINATLFVFGPGGSFVASGRAPLDFTSLTPGDESPFVIRVPVSGGVERYRVGFRDQDDRVLAHVDRRSADTVAQK